MHGILLWVFRVSISVFDEPWRKTFCYFIVTAWKFFCRSDFKTVLQYFLLAQAIRYFSFRPSDNNAIAKLYNINQILLFISKPLITRPQHSTFVEVYPFKQILYAISIRLICN